MDEPGAFETGTVAAAETLHHTVPSGAVSFRWQWSSAPGATWCPLEEHQLLNGAVFTIHGNGESAAPLYDGGSSVELKERPRCPTMSTATFALSVQNRSAELRSISISSLFPVHYQDARPWVPSEQPLILAPQGGVTLRVPLGRVSFVRVESTVLDPVTEEPLSAQVVPLDLSPASTPRVAATTSDNIVHEMLAGRLQWAACGPGVGIYIGATGSLICDDANSRGSARPVREHRALLPLRRLAVSSPEIATLLHAAHPSIDELAAAALAATAHLGPGAADFIFSSFFALVLKQVPMHRPLSAGRVEVDIVCFEVDPVPFLHAFAGAFYVLAAAAEPPCMHVLPPFVDHSFAATKRSIASRFDLSDKANRKYTMIADGSVWRRPHEMSWAKALAELEPRLEGVVQGERAGNCWLCSMLASLAESVPDIVKSTVAPWPTRQHVAASGADSSENLVRGVFSVRLWVDGAFCVCVLCFSLSRRDDSFFLTRNVN